MLLDLQMDRWSMDRVADLAHTAAVIVLTANKSVETGLTALRLSARAIVHKRFAIETLMTALRAAIAGLAWMPPAIQAALVSQDGAAGKKLTPRERGDGNAQCRSRRAADT